MERKWYHDVYRRNVVDMHIPDWDARFLSEFDPEKYVEMLVLSQVKSAVVYAHSHVGMCYYPTKVGHMHKGLKGRNILDEVIRLCHGSGISVVVYFSLIYDCWAYGNNPSWRIIRPNGREAGEHSRYGVCCPNSPYRDYVVAHVEEICNSFDFEGMRFDMTFWPEVCYCPNCQGRFASEVGGEIPRTINWQDPRWVSFQRKREEWLVNFASLVTSAVKRIKPEVTVEHQASTYTSSWRLGVTERLARHNDFLQGDFYGDALQGSFVRKLFYNLSGDMPYGFETSVNVGLNNHTSIKPKELLRAKAYSCLADGGAFVFIDAIDPVGTLNRAVYERMGDIFNETKPYEQYLGGELCQDVAVYLSTESKCDFTDNGKVIDSPHLSSRTPHVEGALNVCKALIESHIPFGVITKRNLGDLSRHQVIVLPNVLMVDEEEMDAFRNYVCSGGSLYVSKYTSLVTKDGVKQADFLLSDLLGVSYRGETREAFTYIAPEKRAEDTFAGHSSKYPLPIYGSQLIVEPKTGVGVLGRVMLPYTDPADPSYFASIHSNPPGISTDYPAVILNSFGKGKVIYVASDLESMDIHRGVFINLVKLLARPFSFEAEAPKPVEITLWKQEDKKRFIISLVNFQKELPNIPINGIKVRVKVDEVNPLRVVLLPDEKELSYEIKGNYLEFIAPQLETFLMVGFYYDWRNTHGKE